MAYGIEAHDKRIATKATDDVKPKHEARLRAICNAVKAKGIRIDTTRNGLDGATITDMGGGTVKVSAPAASKNQVVMLVELNYNYNGLSGTMFMPNSTSDTKAPLSRVTASTFQRA